MSHKTWGQIFLFFLVCGVVQCGSRGDGGEHARQTTQPLLGLGNPVAYWTFDDCSSAGTSLADASGHGFSATRAGGTSCVAGYQGLGVQFDGSTGIVEVPDEPAFHFTNTMTVGAWVNPEAVAGLHTILNKWYAPDSYMLLVQDGQFVFSVALPNGSSETIVSASAPATSGAWTHVAGVYNGVWVRLYVNGVLAAQTAATGPLQQSSRPLCIGSCPSWNAFNGAIDQVWLSTEAFNATEIQRLAFGPALPAPVGYWRFDDCSASSATIHDSSGNGYDGQKNSSVACVPGFANEGGSFDGATASVQISDEPAFHFAKSMTVGAWVNPSTVAGVQTILNKWYAPDSYMLLIQDGQFLFEVSFPNGSWGTVVTVAAPAVAGVWTHVAGVYDGASLKLYTNGSLVAQVSASGAMQQSSRALCIGNCPSWDAFAGTIDEVWLGGDALSPPQIRRLAFGVWPNALSSTISDPWIVQHHDDLVEMHPKVLALNFVNWGNSPPGTTTANMTNTVSAIMQGIRDGSRYHGYRESAAAPFVNYELFKAVDVTDQGNPPPGWSRLNSSLIPVKCDPTPNDYQFDYKALFTAPFTNLYAITDPQNSTSVLDLCQVIQRGMVHEVWLYLDGDPDRQVQGDLTSPTTPYMCPASSGAQPFDLPSLREVLESKQVYNSSNQAVAGQFDACAGNGCFQADDQAVVQACGKSIRILYINSTRGTGCAVHSLGHGIEGTARNGGPLPYLASNFTHFANFDLDTRFGTTFGNSWYGCSAGLCTQYDSANNCTQANDAVSFTSNDSLTYACFPNGSPAGTMAPYDQGCGSVHFPPNARHGYDDGNPAAVLSTCEHYGLGDGVAGTDFQEPYTDANSQLYDPAQPDCQGGWQVYWRQSMPGLDNAALGADGNPMKNWWPFLFY